MIPLVGSALRRTLAVLVVLLVLAPPGSLRAQQTDSTRAGASVPRPGRAAQPDSLLLPQPPISPKRAFLSSLILPGLGQSRLDRPIAGALFVAIEALSLTMIQKSRHDLAFARRAGAIGVPCPGEDDGGLLCLDAGEPGPGNPPTYPNATNPNRFSGGRIEARRQHVEDWFAILITNHLLAGADAYVAAHLWDLPAQLSARPTRDGVALSASLAW